MSEADKYEVLEKIGHGSFGIIRKVRRKVDGQVLCRKEINYLRMSQKEREQLHSEFAILSSLRHPNIVGYFHREHLKTTQDLHLYMEYCGNGDLGKYIKELHSKNQLADEAFIWSIFAQLVTALYRCHYGVDPPEVGSNVMGLGGAKPKTPQGGMMILHRDLKPENVFLGEENSVKLGDFGLSKVMQSHDFASTYVGTPFYMSPEICAAEKYTLKSDIWSLGCIIYELCCREPPFNAKSHLGLIQKIKEGKFAALPPVYSPELTAVIRDCLKVNPDRRPDTAQLLHLPVVRLMRKEREVVELGKLLKVKEEAALQRLREVEDRSKRLEEERAKIRAEVDATVRREWELKARLEIDQHVQTEFAKLQKAFEAELQTRVDAEVQRVLRDSASSATSQENLASSVDRSEVSSSSSLSASDGGKTIVEAVEVSMLSPEPNRAFKKSTRTPFARAQTTGMFAGTPMDVDFAEPSPISIASLSLSPRRKDVAKAPTSGNIFTAAAEAKDKWQPLLLSDDEEDDDIPLPSPTRAKPSRKNPFKVPAPVAARPGLFTQKTAPLPKMNSQSGLISKTSLAPLGAPLSNVPILSSQPELRPGGDNGPLRERATSPNRRLSKIPSSACLNPEGSPTRKPSLTRKAPLNRSGNKSENDDSLSKTAIKNSHAQKNTTTSSAPAGATPAASQIVPPRGRTLVELAQARAGGRPVAVGSEPSVAMAPTGSSDEMSPTKGKRFAVRMAERNSEPPIWDPERDDMPSPFLVRQRPVGRRGLNFS